MKEKIVFIFTLLIFASYLIYMESGNDQVVHNPEMRITPASEALALEYTKNEQNTISIFKSNVESVVFIRNMRIYKSGLFSSTRRQQQTGSGSGFIWDKEGHIVTNYHVIRGGNRFLISFHENPKQYEAVLVGAEPRMDIAVLKLKELPPQLRPVIVSTSEHLQVGQKAIAIGNPFGLDHTMTSGIISALGRSISGVGGIEIRNMIQTDASINPGNSGGPLLNSRGEVIGMNTVIYSSSGNSAGIGFAVPSDTISLSVPQLITHGKVVRPVLGITTLGENYKKAFGITRGIVIQEVHSGTPASKAGLQGLSERGFRIYLGDTITHIDGAAVNSITELYYILNNYTPGDKIKVKFIRGSKELETSLTLSSN